MENKINRQEEIIEEESRGIIEEEDQYLEEDNLEDGEEVIDSSLEIGGQIHQQSDTVRKFYHIPKDVKYSKFNRIDLANFSLKSGAYDLFQYVRKVQSIAKQEIEIIRESKKGIYYIEDLEELKEYFKENNKLYLWEHLRSLDDKQLKESWIEMKQQLKIATETGFIDQIYGDKDNFYTSFENHKENYNRDDNLVDDFGLLSSMMTLTETSKAKEGWATKMMNTTISETKNEDLSKEVEEEPETREGGIRGILKR